MLLKASAMHRYAKDTRVTLVLTICYRSALVTFTHATTTMAAGSCLAVLPHTKEILEDRTVEWEGLLRAREREITRLHAEVRCAMASCTKTIRARQTKRKNTQEAELDRLG